MTVWPAAVAMRSGWRHSGHDALRNDLVPGEIPAERPAERPARTSLIASVALQFPPCV
jgi:hypothetical protein